MTQHMMNVAEFCKSHGISRSLFYLLLERGEGPRIAKVGNRTLITAEAAAEWRKQRERATQGPAR